MPKTPRLLNIGTLAKSRETLFPVIPAKAGIQYFQELVTTLDPGVRRGDDFFETINFDELAKSQNMPKAGASTRSTRTECQQVKRGTVRPERVEGHFLRNHQLWILHIES